MPDGGRTTYKGFVLQGTNTLVYAGKVVLYSIVASMASATGGGTLNLFDGTSTASGTFGQFNIAASLPRTIGHTWKGLQLERGLFIGVAGTMSVTAEIG